MKRRTFFVAIPAAIAGALLLAAPRSVFAAKVRNSLRRLNQNGKPHTQYMSGCVVPYVALEDAEAFHEIAEQVRLQMIARLQEHGAPINVWRVGFLHGDVATDVYSGMVAAGLLSGDGRGIQDEHHLWLRTRVSVEQAPFQFPEEA
jgi:hypothetical protein